MGREGYCQSFQEKTGQKEVSTFCWGSSLATKQSRPEPSGLQDLGVMQQRLYGTRVHDVKELKQHLVAIWADMEQNVIDDAINQWRKRLHACIHARGGISNMHCDLEIILINFVHYCCYILCWYLLLKVAPVSEYH